jgi:hypothetical protein
LRISETSMIWWGSLGPMALAPGNRVCSVPLMAVLLAFDMVNSFGGIWLVLSIHDHERSVPPRDDTFCRFTFGGSFAVSGALVAWDASTLCNFGRSPPLAPGRFQAGCFQGAKPDSRFASKFSAEFPSY